MVMHDYNGLREYQVAGLLVEVQVDYDAGEPPSSWSGGSPPSLDWTWASVRVVDADLLLTFDPFQDLDERQHAIIERYLARAQARGGKVHDRMSDHLACELDDCLAEELHQDFEGGWEDC